MDKNNNLVETNNNFLIDAEMAEMAMQELEGLEIPIQKIKIPSGGALAFDLGEDENGNPIDSKEIDCVIAHKQKVKVYYESDNMSEGQFPTCSSADGKIGIDENGNVTTCDNCPYNKYGSKGKPCKDRLNLYLKLENDIFPSFCSLPSGSHKNLTNYIVNLLKKGIKISSVVTKLTLERDKNKDGIQYSKAKFKFVRKLSNEEITSLKTFKSNCVKLANKAVVTSNPTEIDNQELPFKVSDEPDNLQF